jgi:hypothetical protein
VSGLAGCGLLCLCQNKLSVARKSGVQSIALLYECAECADVHNRSHAFDLDDGPVKGNIIINSG